ncbi:hypothetical protein SAMN05216464_1317 [Mucilaginibacter pineti]|uniref:Uncharacterized protein n=1 Tax=Mucilaginibacter pineti TaxID=1391627 RepID=A0A1G7NXZ6_9SPHI|nr:hypothetical protein [Mucilaginibacter pineti]SDF78902.1 hypothetical protein SAMN05216464_1317 [Mucilaginibacter pineti]
MRNANGSNPNLAWISAKLTVSLAFCQYAIMSDGLLEVNDGTKDERFKDNAFVTGEPDIRSLLNWLMIRYILTK